MQKKTCVAMKMPFGHLLSLHHLILQQESKMTVKRQHRTNDSQVDAHHLTSTLGQAGQSSDVAVVVVVVVVMAEEKRS